MIRRIGTYVFYVAMIAVGYGVGILIKPLIGL